MCSERKSIFHRISHRELPWCPCWTGEWGGSSWSEQSFYVYSTLWLHITFPLDIYHSNPALKLVVPSADTEWNHCRDAYHCALHLSPVSPCGGYGCDRLSWGRRWAEGGPGPCNLSLCTGTDVCLCSGLQVSKFEYTFAVHVVCSWSSSDGVSPTCTAWS